MLPFIPLVLGLLVGPQVVQADFKFTFNSTIRQCEPVSITFFQTAKAKALPTSLTLLPFDSTPISIPLPNAATNSTGVTVTFLPLAAGTRFVASLDDETGDNSAKVSDIFRVFDSPTGDASCLAGAPAASNIFTLPQTVSQCETFNVRYTSAQPPTLRVYYPKGGSTELSQVGPPQDVAGTKTAAYNMTVKRLEAIVLLAFNGDVEQGRTSTLLTVGGDASSSSTCLPQKNGQSNGNNERTDEPTGVPIGVIIGLSVGAAVCVLLSVAIAIYFVRRRRAKKRLNGIEFNPALLEKPSYYKNEPTSPEVNVLPYDYVVNPAYTHGRYSRASSDMVSSPQRPLVTSTSWRPELALPGNVARSASHAASMGPAKTASSINPYDIEQMLAYAAPDSEESLRRPSIREPEPSLSNRTFNSHDSRRPDVPVSMALSNPFGDRDSDIFDTSAAASNGHDSFNSSNFEIVTRPPTSFKAGLKPPSSRFSDPSLMDGGSIGGFPRPTFTSRSPRDSTDSWGNVQTPR